MRRAIFLFCLGMLLGSLLLPVPAGASRFTFTQLPILTDDITTWSGGDLYNLVFPGLHTWNGVPFNLESRPTNNNSVHYNVFGDSPLNIPVNIYGVVKAYTIINSAWGEYGAIIGKIEFFGSGNSYYKADLVEGINVRDHYDGGYNNIIDGINALPAFDNGPGAVRLDMQLYTLPSSFAHETLQNIVYTSYNLGAPQGSPFLAAITVEKHATISGALLLME
jgi:hypothetical protein